MPEVYNAIQMMSFIVYRDFDQNEFMLDSIYLWEKKNFKKGYAAVNFSISVFAFYFNYGAWIGTNSLTKIKQ